MVSLQQEYMILHQIRKLLSFLLASIAVSTVGAADERLSLPDGLLTHADGRTPIQQVYSAYERLLEIGWQLDIITESMPEETVHALPIIALRSPMTGPAAWFLTGIHGEEPAGPSAMATVVDDLAVLGEKYPVVVLPLCNPHGYVRNWRYLNVAVYTSDIDGQSVGDSSHLLLTPPPGQGARAAAPSNVEADAITSYILRMSKNYPPRYSIDLHEDNLINEGYVYSQGVDGLRDILANEAVDILRQNNIGIKMSGQTRFQEDINAGIIGPVADSSIDELMSAQKIWQDGEEAHGPYARTVLVFETPADSIAIEQRINAHADLLRRLTVLISLEADSATAKTKDVSKGP